MLQAMDVRWLAVCPCFSASAFLNGLVWFPAHLPTLHAHAQVFDVRMGARMLASVPFAPGPALLRFHPRFSSTLLLGSASGAFTLADAQGMSGVQHVSVMPVVVTGICDEIACGCYRYMLL